LKWSKIVKIAVIIIVVILIGGLLYEMVGSRLSANRADALIASLRADNQRLRDGLDDAQDRVVKLESTVGDLKLGSEELGRRLETSERIAGELYDENIRLGDSISAGKGAADAISNASRELGSAIDRAWNIVDKYTIPIGSE